MVKCRRCGVPGREVGGRASLRGKVMMDATDASQYYIRCRYCGYEGEPKTFQPTNLTGGSVCPRCGQIN